MVVKHIKITILTAFMVLVGVILTIPKISAQTTVDVDIITYLDGEHIATDQRTFISGQTVIYEVEYLPNAVFMFWVINDVFTANISEMITFTAYENTTLTIYYGTTTYSKGFWLGYNLGLGVGYNNGYEVGVNDVYWWGFDGLINPDTNLPYDETLSFTYGLGSQLGYNNGYDDGIDIGVNDVYYYGFDGFINPNTNLPYDETDSYPYGVGFNDGVEAHNDFSFIGLLTQVFVGIGSVLAIELLPNITIGAIIAVPIVFGIIYFIIGRKRDD